MYFSAPDRYDTDPEDLRTGSKSKGANHQPGSMSSLFTCATFASIRILTTRKLYLTKLSLEFWARLFKRNVVTDLAFIYLGVESFI
jgi:hypothetical protein